MTQSNKFNFEVKENSGKWDAQITRRVSARKTSVSKRQSGFETEALAIEWSQQQLVEFSEKQQQANKRKSARRAERNELAAKAEAEKEAAAAEYQAKRQAAFEAMQEEDFDEE